MRWDGWIEFLISQDGTTVLCQNLSSVAPISVEAYLTNFAVSAALLQRGEEPLHATVVEFGTDTVGFLGESGAGKSTLAAYLIKQGGTLVTDDMLRVTYDEERALAHPGPNQLKLFEEPAQQLLSKSIRRGRFNPLSGKLLFQPCDGLGASRPRRLSALYQLEYPRADQQDRVSLTRLVGLDLFKTITSSTMNSRVDLPARLLRQFQFATRLARSVPVYRLTYKRNYDVLSKVADTIMKSLRP
jgi:hypothetical protein